MYLLVFETIPTVPGVVPFTGPTKCGRHRSIAAFWPSFIAALRRYVGRIHDGSEGDRRYPYRGEWLEGVNIMVSTSQLPATSRHLAMQSTVF